VVDGLITGAPMPVGGRKVSARGLVPVEPAVRAPFRIADDPA
jgi:hypothetical protein